MSQSAEYWKKHILSWEEGAYYKSYENKEHLGLWDRISILFRRDQMYERMQLAVDFLRPHLLDAAVLDVGCASGRFAMRLLQAGAGQVIGVDVVPSAIEQAHQRQAKSDYSHQLSFIQADVTQPDLDLPPVDLVTALGVLEYFDAATMVTFLKNLKAPYFFFDFPHVQKQQNFLRNWFWGLRKIYLQLNRCPGVYFYTLEQFTALAQQAGFSNLRLIRRSRFYYITNLPPLGEVDER